MSIEFVAPDERGVGTADKRRSTQIPGLFYPRQSEFIRGSSSRLPYPRIWAQGDEVPFAEGASLKQAMEVGCKLESKRFQGLFEVVGQPQNDIRQICRVVDGRSVRLKAEV